MIDQLATLTHAVMYNMILGEEALEYKLPGVQVYAETKLAGQADGHASCYLGRPTYSGRASERRPPEIHVPDDASLVRVGQLWSREENFETAARRSAGRWKRVSS